MSAENKRMIVVTEILNKQLEKYNTTIAIIMDNDEKEWYKNYTMTEDEYLQWKDFSITLMRKKLRFSKHSAEKEFLWLNLIWGLRIDNKTNTL